MASVEAVEAQVNDLKVVVADITSRYDLLIPWLKDWIVKNLDRRVDKLEQEIQTMATLDDVQANFMALQTSITNATTLLGTLAAQVKAGAPNQTTIDNLAKELTDAKTAVDAAVAANTPAPAPAG